KNEERKLAEQETKFGSKAEQELHAYAWKSTHMKVHAYAWEANKLTFQSHIYTTSNVTFTSPSLIHPRIGVEDPCICVEGTLAASNHAEPTPESFKRDSKLRKTHA
ncbi:hypothetical protein PIB30_081449, partial [Stylosanthes scabra]|nr:hypothetical protein [Stylosanthes scabra]